MEVKCKKIFYVEQADNWAEQHENRSYLEICQDDAELDGQLFTQTRLFNRAEIIVHRRYWTT